MQALLLDEVLLDEVLLDDARPDEVNSLIVFARLDQTASLNFAVIVLAPITQWGSSDRSTASQRENAEARRRRWG